MRVTIPGIPVSKNRALRVTRNGAFRTAESRTYEATVALCGRIAMRGRPPLTGRLRVYLRVVATNRSRLPDADNCAKAPLDGLRGIVYEDDRQIDDLRIVRSVLKGADPCVEIEIEEVPGGAA